MLSKIKKIEALDIFLIISLGISFLFLVGNAFRGGAIL